MRPSWIENMDYYYNHQGLIVLTEKFLKERGYCCGKGCKHCPYNHIAVPTKNIFTENNDNKK